MLAISSLSKEPKTSETEDSSALLFLHEICLEVFVAAHCDEKHYCGQLRDGDVLDG